MAASAEFYLDTDSEAATFAPGLYVDSLMLKDATNFRGIVLGHTATANFLLVHIGSSHIARPYYRQRSTIEISFNLYDAYVPKSACLQDMLGIFDRLLARDDLRRGFYCFGVCNLAEWADDQAWLHPNPPAGEETYMVDEMLARLTAAGYYCEYLPDGRETQ